MNECHAGKPSESNLAELGNCTTEQVEVASCPSADIEAFEKDLSIGTLMSS